MKKGNNTQKIELACNLNFIPHKEHEEQPQRHKELTTVFTKQKYKYSIIAVFNLFHPKVIRRAPEEHPNI
jgi:hypothetical protein